MSPLRVGIAGRRGGSAVAGLRAAGAQVAAVCDLAPDVLARLGAELDVPPSRRFTSFDDLLASGIDAVVVATPMQLHAPQSAAALRAGLHVLSEVTAAVTLAQCRELWRAAAATDRVYMMAENCCYVRENVLVRALVQHGAFGDPYYAEGEYLHDCKALHHGPDGAPTWRHVWQVGRNGCTYGTHSLGPLMQWLDAGRAAGAAPDPIATVSCVGCGRHTDPEHFMDDTVVMLCKLASGRLARVRLDMLSDRPDAVNRYALQGTAGCYESAAGPGLAPRIWLRGREVRWFGLEGLDDALPAWYRAMEGQAAGAGHGGADFFAAYDFVRACRGEIESPIGIRDALAWTLAGLCSQQSIARGGLPLPVPPPEALAGGDDVPCGDGGEGRAGWSGGGEGGGHGVGGSGVAAGAGAGGHGGSGEGEDQSSRGGRGQAASRLLPSQLVMRAPATTWTPAPEAPPAGYTLRRAGVGDAEPLARCLGAAFGGGWDGERARRELLGHPDVSATFLVGRGATVVATASVIELRDRFPEAGCLHWVAVDPVERGARLGRVVSLAAMAHVRRAGPRDIVLHTDDHRLPAIATYLALGFVPEYRDPSHPRRWSAVFAALGAARRGG